MPGDFEINGERSDGNLTVRADGFEKIFHFGKIFLAHDIFGLVGFNYPVSGEFEPMISFSLKI
ncbi:MAG: hypothetical protein CO142_01385, partial [Candidatus Moranbacteria bacterium CG_4_9_14_3_um_filter_44_28]